MAPNEDDELHYSGTGTSETDELAAEYKGNIRDCPIGEAGKKTLQESDIDGGWAWMICFSCFIVNFIVDGVIFSFGVFFIKLMDYYDETRSKAAWVGSTLLGTCMFMGPVVSLLLEYFSCRQVMILGSLISSAGFILSVIAPNVETLIFTFGFLGGIGFGLTFITAILTVGLHFNKKRALATGIATSGSGVGTVAMSYLAERILNEYGLKGAILIMAGFVCNLFVCGALLRPLVKQTSGFFTQCFSFCKKKTHTFSKSEVHEASQLNDEERSAILTGINVQEYLDEKIPRLRMLTSVDRLIVKERHMNLSRSIEHVTVKGDEKDRRYKSDFHLHSTHAQPNHPRTLQEIFGKPLRRKDILYSGSLYNLPEYQKDPNMASFLKSMASLSSEENDIHPDKYSSNTDFTGRKVGILTAYKELLCDKLFLMLLVVMVCWTGQGTVVMFIPDLAVSKGVSTMNAALLLSIVGGTNMLGQLLAGWLANHRNVDSVLVYACALVLAALTSALFPFCSSFLLFVLCSCVFGCCMGTCVSLRTIVLVDVLGISKLTKSFGITTFIQGIAFTISPPLSGALYDSTRSFLLSYWVSAGMYFVAFITCILIRPVQKCLYSKTS